MRYTGGAHRGTRILVKSRGAEFGSQNVSTEQLPAFAVPCCSWIFVGSSGAFNGTFNDISVCRQALEITCPDANYKLERPGSVGPTVSMQAARGDKKPETAQ